MNSKERTAIALSRRLPDRVPVAAEFVPEVKKILLEHFHTDDYYDMCVKIGSDMLVYATGISTSFYLKEENEYVCPWGCGWKYFENKTGRYAEIVRHPLADDPDGTKLHAYRTPDPDAPAQYLPFRELVERYGKTHFICGSVACSIFEAAWYLHGMEETIEDMLLRPEYTAELFDKTMQFTLHAGLHFIDEGADMIWLGDDVGMQDGMLFSPAMWRELLKPRMAVLISAYKARNPKVLVAYHSCGNIMPIIDDLIEIGLDVLNPIQPHAMDPADIKRKFGDRLAFWGSIDIQDTLPHGSREDIRAEVKLRMETIGKGGGLLLTPAHNVQSDTSLANILAFYEAARELGNYA